ncbi:MAG: hypothetical protein HY666_04835 [Chloroflexi bacterium]|nr:hypothetical protein [Chloroflexota bacterium]
MKQSFDDILNDCLERLARGEHIQGCLDLYPNHVQELAPLLRVAKATIAAASAAAPDELFKSRALYRLMAASSEQTRPRRRLPSWTPALARPMALIAIVILLIGGATTGMVAASANSVPGEPLYTVKRTKEGMEMRMARSDISRAQIQTQMAHNRMQEIRRLMLKKEIDKAEALTPVVRGHLRKAATFAGVSMTPQRNKGHLRPIPFQPMPSKHLIGIDNLRQRMQQDVKTQRGAMKDALRQVPPQYRSSLESLVGQSLEEYDTLLKSLTERDPSLQPVK